MTSIAFATIATAVAILAAAVYISDRASRRPDLRQIIERRYLGDRTSVCIAAAWIEDVVERAVVCADAAHPRAIDGASAFEIGSVSKTMTAALLADLVDQGKLALTDPVARHLPEGTTVPTFHGAPIRLVHLVTHTSGLPGVPSQIVGGFPDNPYAVIGDAVLLAALADVELTAAPGTQWAYSNFGVMLLSYVVARVGGRDFEALARDRLFAPLGMRHAHVGHPPPGTKVVTGHRSTGEPTRAWDFTPNLAGVGGVRATLDDMIAYVSAQLGRGDAHTTALLARTHAAVDLGMPRDPEAPEMAMGWIREAIAGRTVLVHEGGTGGFSSLVAIDREANRALVLLADTSLVNVGGLSELALHLFDPSAPLPPPRTVATPDRAVIRGLVGRYQLAGLAVELVDDDGALVARFAADDGAVGARLAGGDTLHFGHDSHGDFFARELDGVLSPVRAADGRQTFLWLQAGASTLATRLAE